MGQQSKDGSCSIYSLRLAAEVTGWMDPLLPADTELMEPEADKDAKRKIQFSVPSSVPTQLDPRQVELIRRRRPTPATLFRLTDPPSPEEDIDPHQWVLGENGALKAKLVHTTTYQPPSLKAVQRMALAHLASLDLTSVDKEDSSSGEEEEEREKKSQQSPSATDPREESHPLRDQCAQLDSLTESAELSLHRSDEEEAKEREEKGE
ncbi:protein phosphatase 1 regulatory subunit 1B-like isoform X2 [Eleginops maclovinus]